MDNDVTVRRQSGQQRRRWATPRFVAASAVGFIAVMLVASQLILPSIATSRLTDSLSRSGEGVHVRISAFPALELLFGDAETVDVRIRKLVSSSHHVGDLLVRIGKVDSLTATIEELDTHGLVLRGVSLRKRGSTLTAQGAVTRAAVQAVLPLHLAVTPLPPGTDGLLVHGTFKVLGQTLHGTAEVQATGGKIVLSPRASGLASLLNAIHLTVFDNPAVSVDTVHAVSNGDRYTLSASGHYR